MVLESRPFLAELPIGGGLGRSERGLVRRSDIPLVVAADCESALRFMNGHVDWQGPGIQTPHTELGHVVNPAEAMVRLEEADPRGRNLGTWVLNVAPSPGWIDPFAIFHGRTSTISLADGRVIIQWEDDSAANR